MYNNVIGCFSRDLGFKTLEESTRQKWKIVFQVKEYIKAHDRKRLILIFANLI